MIKRLFSIFFCVYLFILKLNHLLLHEKKFLLKNEHDEI